MDKSIPPPLLTTLHATTSSVNVPLFLAAFVVQFLLLSLCFGIPLLTFFISCGQYLGSGLIDMWRVSPIFQVRPRDSKGISKLPLIQMILPYKISCNRVSVENVPDIPGERFYPVFRDRKRGSLNKV